MHSSVPMALDVDAKEVRDISLDCQFEPYPLHILDDPVQLFEIWSCEDGVVSVQDVDGLALHVHALFQLALAKSDGLEFAHQVLVPDTTCLFLAIDVFLDLEDIVSFPFHLEAFGISMYMSHLTGAWV